MPGPQTSYADIDAIAGRAGGLIGVANKEIISLSSGGTTEEWTVQVTGAVDDTAYTYTTTDAQGVNTAITFTSGTGATTTTIATGLAAAHNASGAAGAYSEADSATDTVTITGRHINVAFTVTESDDNLGAPVNTRDASEAATIHMGVGTVQRAFGECAAPNTTDMDAQVQRIVPTATDDTLYSVSIRMLDTGDQYTAQIDSGVAATVASIVAALVVALDAALPANTVDEDGASTTHIDLTSELLGVGFEVDVNVNMTVSEQTPNNADQFLGATRHLLSGEHAADADYVYPGRSDIPIVQKGDLYVLLDAGVTVALGDRVYCRHTAAGAEVLGAFRTDRDTSDAFLVPGARWAGANFTGFDGHNVAALSLNLSL